MNEGGNQESSESEPVNFFFVPNDLIASETA